MLRSISILILCLVSNATFSQLVINETSPKGSFVDEDGETNDWIELYNAGTSAIDLSNYSIGTDSTGNNSWQLPIKILQPDEYFLILASAKDRKPAIDHWETVVEGEGIWKFHIGTAAPLPDWRSLTFNDNTWLTGQGGFGYGDGDDNTIFGSTPSVYLRKVFDIVDTAAILEAIFHIDFDDGFVAYLNEVEIARANMIGNPPASTTHRLHRL